MFAEGMEEKCIVPRTDTVSGEQDDMTFCRPKLPRRVVFTEQDMNFVWLAGGAASKVGSPFVIHSGIL